MSSIDWYNARAPVIEAVRDGYASVSEHVEAGPVIGPSTYTKLAYPYAEVLPESTNYTGGNQFEHLVRQNLYFERERDAYDAHPGDAYLDQLAVAMDAVDGAMDELDAEELAVSYLPTTIEDFSGEIDDRPIIMISTQLRVTSVLDLADSSPDSNT